MNKLGIVLLEKNKAMPCDRHKLIRLGIRRNSVKESTIALKLPPSLGKTHATTADCDKNVSLADVTVVTVRNAQER
jgi:hypothetical protein